MSKDKSGPAFPQPCTENGYASNSEFEVAGGGMTLRDYFAAKVLNGLVAMAASNGGVGAKYSAETDNLAKCAYVVADAMLKARGE